MNNYDSFQEFPISPMFIVRMNEMCWKVSFIFLVGELNEKWAQIMLLNAYLIVNTLSTLVVFVCKSNGVC